MKEKIMRRKENDEEERSHERSVMSRTQRDGLMNPLSIPLSLSLRVLIITWLAEMREIKAWDEVIVRREAKRDAIWKARHPGDSHARSSVWRALWVLTKTLALIGGPVHEDFGGNDVAKGQKHLHELSVAELLRQVVNK